MKFNQYLITEKASKNTIVVDIQPMYEKWINFKMYDFIDFLNTQTKDILYFYNGPETVGEDSQRDLEYWLLENGLDKDKFGNIEFVDKGYGFFRNMMDEGIEASVIIKMVRHMFQVKKYDSRDIEEDEWLSVLGEDTYEEVEGILNGGDMINIPDIDIRTLKKYSGGYIVGGGKNECLAEVQLLMSAFNFKAKEVRRYVY